MPNNANFYQHLAARFPADLSTSAIVTGQNADYSWREVDQASAKLANLFGGLNLPAKAKLAVHIEKSPEALIVYLAAWRAGLTLLSIPPQAHTEEIQSVLKASAPAVVICSPRHFGWLAQSGFQHGASHVFTLHNGYPNQGSLLHRAALLSNEFSAPITQDDDIALIRCNWSDGNSSQHPSTHQELSAHIDLSLTTLHELTGFKLAF